MKKEGTGWGCPHDDRGRCVKRESDCDPGAQGCVLEDRFKGAIKPGGGQSPEKDG